MSPRRSSRARSSQIPPTTISHANSSSTSVHKVERNGRTGPNGSTRTVSPKEASAARSESVDDADSASRANADSSLGPRRSRRGNDLDIGKDKNGGSNRNGEGEGEDEAIEEDVTRCICGQPEYPGAGQNVKEQFSASESVSDEIGNFFVQCDKCHVWQHGGCMGFIDESTLPDEYYCELCRPNYHKIMKTSNGTRSSLYFPLHEPWSMRSSSLSSTDAPRKSGEKNKPLESTKRRATMNSSRGAYDEDEMFRRAIEASKETGGALGKRAREETEDHKSPVKRQRTGSSISSVDSRRSQSPHPTTEDGIARSSMSGIKNSSKLRGAAAKTSREKELRDKQKEQIAAQRAEAANKRHARSERRRGDESPPPTPSLSPTKAVQSVAATSKTKTETSPLNKAHHNRKGGRPPTRKGRLGRNQYTRDLPLNGETSDSPHRDTSHDRQGIDSPRPHTNGYKDNINGESGRSSKAKTHPARTSMNEMKRRVAAILEFVGRMQTERASSQPQTKNTSSDGSRSSESSSLKGNSTPNGSSNPTNLPTANLVKAVTKGLEEADELKKQADENSGDSESVGATIPTMDIKPERDFQEMNSMEMMENLTKELVSWQSLYGIYVR